MMMSQKTVHIEGVGEVLLARSHRAKHIHLSVRPFLGIRVAVPAGVSFKQAAEAARARAGWLIKSLDRMALKEMEAAGFPAPHPVGAAAG